MDFFEHLRLSQGDYLALVIFAVSWLGYEPLLKILAARNGSARKDLQIVRHGWMMQFIGRDVKIFDSNLLGHSVNTASFFASANLLIIAAIGGVIFEGNLKTGFIKDIGIEASRPFEVQLKLCLVLLCLVRGLLDFVWALRQMNYCAAAWGAVPHCEDDSKKEKYCAAITAIVEPAMTTFSQGVRTYYFSIAAGLWLFGPWVMAIASIAVFILLAYRQTVSPAAKGLRQLRLVLESENKE